MSHRKYQYVGTNDILEAASSQPSGIPINSVDDAVAWLSMERTEQRSDGNWIATFTISPDRKLYIAPRRSEHVACANGGPVLSAGEIIFDETFTVVEITNQSTGFCPEPESWLAVESTLNAIGFNHPGEFTTMVIFRRCPNCNERNIVKDSWFYCSICEAELPKQWNFDDSEMQDNNALDRSR